MIKLAGGYCIATPRNPPGNRSGQCPAPAVEFPTSGGRKDGAPEVDMEPAKLAALGFHFFEGWDGLASSNSMPSDCSTKCLKECLISTASAPLLFFDRCRE
ncbi:unnamed protein product [Linum tenue]|uniref:Uncharacterized protein n=1 Tax=Linum tenue TaxID=586396 RepID=A0AAV0PCM3_9ROSI|nr:unnamed protein product [Linum tenue]